MRINAGIRNPLLNNNILNIRSFHRKETDKPLVEKIKTVAKVVFSILLSLVLFSINPGIFFISFVIGIAFSNHIQHAVDKINIFMKRYKWPFIGGAILSAALVLPVFIATASVIWSAHMGSILSQRAQNQR